MKGILQNKNIVIIGGTSGIGLSAAQAFLVSGANVVAVGLDEESCRAARISLGDQVRVLAGDATREGTAEAALDLCATAFGSCDGLYHVAGGSGRRWGDGPVHECTLEGWERTLELNLSSVMLSNRAVIRQWLQEERGGSILNLSSVLAMAPAPQFFATHAYAAAKAAVIGFSRSLAAYYASYDIKVNVLAPALTETPMAQRALDNQEIMTFVKNRQPLDGGRAAQPSDLDGAACYFLSDQAGFTTGQVLAVDGGWSL